MSETDFGPCPVCNGLKGKILFSTSTPISEFTLVLCGKCKLIRTRPFPSDQLLHKHGFAGYYGKKSDKFIPAFQRIRNGTMRSRARSYLSFIPDGIEKPKILDVGCGEGRLLNAFLDYGCDCWGIEHPHFPSERFISKDRILYSQDGFGLIDVPEGGFDLIFLWHALEHMDDPQKIFKRLYKLLASEGTLVLAVPNFSSLESKRFREFWFHLDIPWHKYHFSELSIGYLIKRNKFKIIRSSTLCFELGLYGFIQSILNSMGWPKNEFYEALKGDLKSKRETP
ncbi:MAG: class I SAM-dependent methyltransferase, partial [Pseudomonadota bacterium]